MRVRLGGLTIWRLQCTTCRAVFTVLPHFVLRYRQMRPEVARDALLATHGGLSLELCAVIYHISPMALYRLVCALGQHSLVTRADPVWPAAARLFPRRREAQPLSHRKVYLPTIVSGRVHLASGLHRGGQCGGLYPVLREFQRAASQQEPSYRVRGVLIDGFDSTTKSMRTLFPGARLGNCLRHALNKLPETYGHRVPGPQGVTLPVPHPVAQGTPAEGLAGVCARPAVTPLRGPRRHHGRERPMASGCGGGFRTSCAVKSGKEECSNTVGCTGIL